MGGSLKSEYTNFFYPDTGTFIVSSCLMPVPNLFLFFLFPASKINIFAG